MSILNNFYRNYLSWMPNYYYLKIKHPETEYPLIICQGYKNR